MCVTGVTTNHVHLSLAETAERVQYKECKNAATGSKIMLSRINHVYKEKENNSVQ